MDIQIESDSRCDPSQERKLTWEKPTLTVFDSIEDTQSGTATPFEDQTGWAS